MNIRYKVYYQTKEQYMSGELVPFSSWKSVLPHKKIRASSDTKAMEIFRHKYPDLVPITASLY